MRLWWAGLWALAGCGGGPAELGVFTVEFNEDGSLDVVHSVVGPVLEGVRAEVGSASADVEMQYGAFRFNDESTAWRSGNLEPARGRRTIPLLLEITDDAGEAMGTVSLFPAGDALVMDLALLEPTPKGESGTQTGLLGISAECGEGDAFLGLGGHAQDVDHYGEEFHLWVQEPGIGKTTDDEIPANWPIGGAKHDTSLPVPAMVRPNRAQAMILEASGRVDVDLCAHEDRFHMIAWQDVTRFTLLQAPSGRDAISAIGQWTGTLSLPPPWAFAPWSDAIRGVDRVQTVAARLREFDVPATAIWTEDWKGAEETAFGYRLLGEWNVDEGLYPDASGIATELESMGFHWMAYFSPFLMEGTNSWDEALADDVMIKREDGTPYTFSGASFRTTTVLDLSSPEGQQWAKDRMQGALDLGFDGWMADFAEWLPVDADLASGADAFKAHNEYPLLWQVVNQDVTRDADAVFFVRSGWLGTSGLVPAVWGGDQRTDFQTDDGFPTLIPMGLTLATSGIPVFTHDIAGYNSVGNPPSTKELWFRWASLGAYSPIMRTHHGAFDTENWQFDSDDETTEHFAAMATEHMRLFPYRYGLAYRASLDGTPMLLPVAAVHGGDWGRMDAWMLGDALLVAPVMEEGALSRDVELPEGTRWWRWPELTPATSGTQTAELNQIPVFVSEGMTVPTFDVVPDTLVESDAVDPALTTLAEADATRTVYVFGAGGLFVEADGTTYTPSGTPSSSGQVTEVLVSGSVEVAGMRVDVTGTTERTYTFVVVN